MIVRECATGMPRPGDVAITGSFRLCATFLDRIGIPVILSPGADGFLPGIRILGGSILVTAADDGLAGDLLHEAGHVAVVPALFRPLIDDDVSGLEPAFGEYIEAHPDGFSYPEDPVCRGIIQSGEQEAAAWSYAAAVAAGIDPWLPFSKGFNDEGRDVLERMRIRQHYGINGLAAGGMTRLRGADAFPSMIRWLQV